MHAFDTGSVAGTTDFRHDQLGMGKITRYIEIFLCFTDNHFVKKITTEQLNFTIFNSLKTIDVQKKKRPPTGDLFMTQIRDFNIYRRLF